MDQTGTGSKGGLHVQQAVVLSQARRWISSGSGFLTPKKTTSTGTHQVQGNLRDVGPHRERTAPILLFRGPFRAGLADDAQSRASHHHRFHPAWPGSIPVDPDPSGYLGSRGLLPTATHFDLRHSTRPPGARRSVDSLQPDLGAAYPEPGSNFRPSGTASIVGEPRQNSPGNRRCVSDGFSHRVWNGENGPQSVGQRPPLDHAGGHQNHPIIPRTLQLLQRPHQRLGHPFGPPQSPTPEGLLVFRGSNACRSARILHQAQNNIVLSLVRTSNTPSLWTPLL